VRRASSTRRFIRCRVTERRATFLGTTTAYPLALFENTAEKCMEEKRRPERILGNNARERRFLIGNTEKLDSEFGATDTSSLLDDFSP